MTDDPRHGKLVAGQTVERLTLLDDPRMGLPSASALPRLSRCGASFLLAKEARRQGIAEQSNPDAESGTRIALAMATDDDGILSDAERDMVARMRRGREAVITQWLTDIGGNIGGVGESREARLWWNESGANQFRDDTAIFSGQADLVCVWIPPAGPGHACIIDEKSGRGEYVEAAGNAQLAGLAVLWSDFLGVRSARVAINQPWQGPPSVADFDGPALDEAKRQLLALLDHIQTPGLEPVPGDHCQYCAAKTICPALAAEVRVVATVSFAKERIGEALALLDGNGLSRLLDIGKRAEWTIAAARAEAKRRLAENSPDAPEGWILSNGAKTADVPNLQNAFGVLDAMLDVTADEMLAACKGLSLPNLAIAVGRRAGISQKQARERIENALGDLIERGQRAPSLVEAKPEAAELVEDATP